MPIVNSSFIHEKLDYLQHIAKQKMSEYEKYKFYSGGTKDIIEEKIRREFHNQDNVEDLKHRLLPLNFMKKIIDKSAGVYVEAPSRYEVNQDEADQELINDYERILNLNVKMRTANRHAKMFKKSLAELYLDDSGFPQMRILPPHTYQAFSHSYSSPHIPDTIVKIINAGPDKHKQRYAFYTNETFVIVDGNGQIVRGEMERLNNSEGVNPMGVLPFVYLNESEISIEPIQDDDLFNICVSMPIVLSDLSIASKYQAYSLLYTIDYDGDIPSGPAGVMHLTSNPDGSKPEVGQLSPTVNVGDTLQLIESVMAYLLTSKGLNGGAIQGTLSVNQASSGISKAIENSGLASDIKDQQATFRNFERELWYKLSDYMIPYWRSNRQLHPSINRDFSSTFDLSIHLREPKVTMTEAEQIKISKEKLDAGLSTRKRELSALNPDMTPEQIEELDREIEEYQARQVGLESGMEMPEEDFNGEQG